MTQSNTCPECKGSGVYQGLNTVEPCRACGGKKAETLVRGSEVDLSKWPTYHATTSTKAFDVLRDAQQACQQFSGQPMRHEIEEQAAEPKPFDEIMPAELEELDDGDRVSVEIHCNDPRRPFDAVDKFVGRKLFGKPINTFHLESVYVVDGLQGVFGELVHLPFASEFAARNRATLSDPCQDMLFIPVED